MDEGAAHYPREYLHALRTMIDRRDPAHALSLARMLVDGGHEARVWRCYTKMFFRLGIALQHPYLIDVFTLNAEPANLCRNVAAHERALDILFRATRDRAVLRFVFWTAAHLDQPPMPAPSDPNQRMFKSMHAMCTPHWAAHIPFLIAECGRGVGTLPKCGPQIARLMQEWRAAEPDWHFGAWKYPMATLGLFLYFKHRCDMSQSDKYRAPAEPAHEWPAAWPPERWSDEFRFPVHRQPSFGWRYWVRRPPRMLVERVGEEVKINTEHPPTLPRGSARIAQERMHEVAVTRLPEVVGADQPQVYGYSNNPMMNVWPSRLSGAFEWGGMKGFEAFGGVSVVRMHSDEEAADVEASLERLKEWWGVSTEALLLPFVRIGSYLVVPFLFENQFTVAEEDYLCAMHALFAAHGMPVHRASVLRTHMPIYYVNPFVGAGDDIGALIQPAPDAALRFVEENMYE